jgi:hypothetical protein
VYSVVVALKSTRGGVLGETGCFLHEMQKMSGKKVKYNNIVVFFMRLDMLELFCKDTKDERIGKNISYRLGLNARKLWMRKSVIDNRKHPIMISCITSKQILIWHKP